MSAGAWQMVVRRKKYPPHWRHAPNPVPTTHPYQPFKLTYAQSLRNPPPTPQPASTKTNTPPQPPANPPTKPSTTTTGTAPHQTASSHYLSPHAQLRFPPSPTFKEWRGLCFRCCKRGHTARQCKNLRRCGRCWGEGHTGSHCNKHSSGHPYASPTNPAITAQPAAKPAHSFDELLTGPYPYPPKQMPEGRTPRTFCYADRDTRPTKEYTAPPCASPPAASTAVAELHQNEETSIPVPIRVLREIYLGRDPSTLPLELTAVLHNSTPPEPLPLLAPIATPTQATFVTEDPHLVTTLVTEPCAETPVANMEPGTQHVATPKAAQSQPKRILTRRRPGNRTDTDVPGCGADPLALTVAGTDAVEPSKNPLRGPHQARHVHMGNEQRETNSCLTPGRTPQVNSNRPVNGPGRPLGPGATTRQRKRLTLAGIRPKRNTSTAKKNRAEPQAANFNLNPEGFVEIRVDYDHRLAIATTCGINVEQVTTSLKEDNAQRLLLPEAQPNKPERDLNEEQVNLELSSDEELTDME
ncbi:hypothetical protein FCM35_KLT02459 [Carex littledalei]|uniref:CCHC-type domain-containing protein n=1 Tax=Carex littledalei TaxID=544730 RepID=A0A833R3Z5_9POAL|nr:hypothetical protein FCM35_KLT02459 [Carex littledalei]